MSKKNDKPIDQQPEVEQQEQAVEQTEQPTETPKRTKTYIFPDIDGGGPSVTIEATSIEEATELFRKGQA